VERHLPHDHQPRHRHSSVHERLYRTGEGRWVLHWWAQWRGRLDRWSFATDGYARDWLLANGHDAALEEHFGPIEPKRGPGRPPIGRPIQVRLPDGLLARLDAFAGELNRAEAAAFCSTPPWSTPSRSTPAARTATAASERAATKRRAGQRRAGGPRPVRRDIYASFEPDQFTRPSHSIWPARRGRALRHTASP
jgi:hypothetical protein